MEWRTKVNGGLCKLVNSYVVGHRGQDGSHSKPGETVTVECQKMKNGKNGCAYLNKIC